MDQRRRFNARERAALYRLADGKCVKCGRPLDRKQWHADHREPHVHGGLTDVTNGQALCPPCNLRKGSRMAIEPRPWQRLFLAKYTAASPEKFLLVACPAAGKTLAAGFIVRDLLRDGVVDRVLVVVPSFTLREQWSAALAKLDICVDGQTSNNRLGEMDTLDGQPVQGWVVTYQSLTVDPEGHRALNSSSRTLVILDEVHHLSVDDGSWGQAAGTALAPCTRFLSLSGTPFRGDNGRLPFVEYESTPDGGWQCRYKDGLDGTPYPFGFDYSYGVALTDNPPPVRPVVFEHYDGDVEWMDWDIGEPTRVRVSDEISDKKIRSRANRHVLNPAGDWLSTVLADADRRLSMVQAEGDPTAKGLVVCLDTKHADAVRDRLQRITTGKVYTAISKGEDGSDRTKEARTVIDNFGAGDGRWLVAVQMVTEGVDIPQLRVGVYATVVRSPLFFRQLVGRVVRRRDDLHDEVDQTSYLFVPKEPKMLELADSVRDEITLGLIASSEDLGEDDEQDRAPGAGREFDLPLPFDPFRESTADEAGVLIPGQGTLPSGIVRLVAEQSGISFGTAATVLAAAVRVGFGTGTTTPVQEQPQAAERPKDKIGRRRDLLEKLIRQYAGLLVRTGQGRNDDLGKTIGAVKSTIYADAGIYRNGMSTDEKKHAYRRADTPALNEAIQIVTKLLAQ